MSNLERENPRKFKFNIEDNKYIWNNSKIKLVFSKPSIQGNDEHAILTSSKGILYYYYNIEIYRSIYDDYDDENDESIYKWDLVASRGTHDFPCIEQLQFMAEDIIIINPVSNGEKHEYRSGKVEYSKHYHTQGFACDDFYEITKYTDENGNKPHYIVYLGCTFDGQGDLNSAGIRTPYLEENDIIELSKCVNAFIQYSIDIHNESTIKMNKSASLNKEIVEGKLYEYKDYENNFEDCINKNRIESIYIVGDKIDITMLETNEKGEVYSDEYVITIKDLIDGKVVDTDGRTFDIDKIMFIMDDVPLGKKYYNIDMVTKDFLELMTNKEIEEFKMFSEEKLYERYLWAIINRTTMCWDDTHDFPVIVDKGVSGWNIKNAKAVVKVVINNIKNTLN